jgi:hypothetical protein
MRGCVVGGLLAVVGMWCAGQLYADEAAEKKAAELLQKYVEATGGEQAFAKIKNRVTEMSWVMPVSDATVKLTVYRARPNKSYMVMDSTATGKLEQGCDGTVVWEKSELTGCRIKSGQERALVILESTLDRFAHWRDAYEKAEYIGTDEVEGKSYHKIKMTPKAVGDELPVPELVYMDGATNLITKIEGTYETAADDLLVTQLLSDYRQVDGIKLCHKLTLVVAGDEQVLTVDSVKNNVDLADDRFARPEEVQAMLKDK